jgi:predicted nucleic acid-binding protein
MEDIYSCLELTVVVDNNILIDLFELDKIDLLFKVTTGVIIPDVIIKNEVRVEILVALSGHSFSVGKIETEKGLELYGKLVNNHDYRNLSTQDRFAIAIAEDNNCLCNSNDALVRKACQFYNVKCIGLLGILARALFQKAIDKVEFNSLLDLLKSNLTSCFITEKVIEEFRQKFN